MGGWAGLCQGSRGLRQRGEWDWGGARTCSTGGISPSLLGHITRNCFPGDARLHVGQLLGWAWAEQGGESWRPPGDGGALRPSQWLGPSGVAAGGRLVLRLRASLETTALRPTVGLCLPAPTAAGQSRWATTRASGGPDRVPSPLPLLLPAAWRAGPAARVLKPSIFACLRPLQLGRAGEQSAACHVQWAGSCASPPAPLPSPAAWWADLLAAALRSTCAVQVVGFQGAPANGWPKG